MPSTRPDLLAGQQFPPPPKQKRSRQKRDALLQSALALFAEVGSRFRTIRSLGVGEDHRGHVVTPLR